MYKDYIEGGGKCQYAMYRKQIAEKNISFAKLGTEECENCLEFDEHPCSRNRNNKTPPPQQQQQQQQICEVCVAHELHVTNDKNARMAYKSDSSKVNTVEESYFSVDLQKVVMLPRLPGVKTVAFTKRIIGYNETFAPLGDKRKLKTKTMRPYAMAWHEAIGGRSAQEITSVFKEFIEFHLEVKEFVFWADNCSAQNKSWYLYTMLVYLVNSKNSPLNSITMKYFERGHSFMSADSYHHLVELAMTKMRNVCDFRDFCDALENDGKAIVMQSSNFLLVPRGLNEKSKFTGNHPNMEVICISKFIRGST